MPVTPVDLATPIRWQDAKYSPLLNDLQGNILKGHGRHHTLNLFLNVKSGKAESARKGLAKIAPFVTSAARQLTETDAFRDSGLGGGTAMFVFLSSKGYNALGAKATKTPTNGPFKAGMAASSALADPKSTRWDTGFQKPIHAMILIAGCSATDCESGKARILKLLGPGWGESHSEFGEAIFDDVGRGLEHFGYVDGRSQPLMLADEVDREKKAAGGHFVWDPQFGPGEIALVKDPAGVSPDSHGSYFIFRKLKQDVKGFKDAESALSAVQTHLAATQGLPPPDSELAGAMIVGRFENGAPVTKNDKPGTLASVDNNFTYQGDAGNRCPMHAHIRKTNPRDGSEKRSIMPRRGIPYGGPEGSPGDVGLLFMAYNQDLVRQFEFIQTSWVNSPGFPVPNTGVDPIIGQGPATRPLFQNCPVSWDKSAKFAGDFQQFVTMRGGEYFFAPSISGLTNLT